MRTDSGIPGREDGGGDGRRPRLSVIIPCLNAADTIGKQLEALARQEWSEPWEVVILDNGSTDETLAVAETGEEAANPSSVLVTFGVSESTTSLPS